VAASYLEGGETAGGGAMPGGGVQQAQATVACSCDGCTPVETTGWVATHGRLVQWWHPCGDGGQRRQAGRSIGDVKYHKIEDGG
jgi:hypothetical protein